MCVCEYLGEGADEEVVLFSVDSSDPPISSDPLLEELFPKETKSLIYFPLSPFYISCTEEKIKYFLFLPYSH